ncbi:hypothetical protein LIER_40965 [Lithospermum erythrorhizon]|uniref:Uncharacterized protein n=1 Tax=Lithospermum erythrorhizon TaxID=34254 RepID=A0AAV3R5B9_LITER
MFIWVAITTKAKPRESLVPEAVASSPFASGTSLPTPSVNPLLKRMASDALPTTQPMKKAKKPLEAQKKKKSQPLTRGSSDEGSRRPSAPAPVEAVVNHPPVVTIDSSTIVSDQDVDRQMEMADRLLSLWQELNTPFPAPAQEVAVEEEILPLQEEVAPKAP